MGEAKRRREQQLAEPTIYHHTSTLRTNLLWMSGHIAIEGESQLPPFHPELGRVALPDTSLRRAVKDFPKVAWFTTRVSVPKCLTNVALMFVDKETGEQRGEMRPDPEVANAIALHRVAIGFRAADTTAVRWPAYFGYDTPEGRELNDSAREFGDDPDDWWVSETPVDLMLAAEFWSSSSIQRPKLERRDNHLPDMKRMVTICRERPGTFIPPTWVTPEQGAKVARALGVPVGDIRD